MCYSATNTAAIPVGQFIVSLYMRFLCGLLFLLFLFMWFASIKYVFLWVGGGRFRSLPPPPPPPPGRQFIGSALLSCGAPSGGAKRIPPGPESPRGRGGGPISRGLPDVCHRSRTGSAKAVGAYHSVLLVVC
jgi:hypothetical protein